MSKPPRRRGPDQKPRKRPAVPPTPPPPGPGKPVGSNNALPIGAVSAIRALRHRVPKDLPPEVIEVADRAMGTVIAVMDGSIWHDTASRLQAARYVREEICGAIPQKTELSVVDTLAERVKEARERHDAKR